MVATPKYVPGEHRDPLATRLAALEKTVAAIGNKTLYSASIGSGGLTINGSGGIKLPVGGTITDANGVVLLQSDPLGGIAYPWYSVPLLGLHIGPTGPTGTTTYPNGTLTQAWQQYNTADAGLTTNGWFAGFLPYVSHPRLRFQTFAETAAVGGTATFYVAISTNNFATQTVIGTWVENQFNGQFSVNEFDMTPYLGEINVGVAVGLQSFTGGAGFILLQPYGCFLRGSV